MRDWLGNGWMCLFLQRQGCLKHLISCSEIVPGSRAWFLPFPLLCSPQCHPIVNSFFWSHDRQQRLDPWLPYSRPELDALILLLGIELLLLLSHFSCVRLCATP